MDNSTRLNALSEAKVLAKLAEYELHIFTQTIGKAPFDMVILFEKKLFKVSVKSTSCSKGKYGAYDIELRRIRSNKNKNQVYNFSKEDCDIVAVYIEKLDKVCFIPSELIGSTTAINFREDKTKFSKVSWIISEWEDLNKTLKYLEGQSDRRRKGF